MEPMSEEEGEKLFERALEALSAGEAPSALALLERAVKLADKPSWNSCFGYCIAKERGQVKTGSDLCLAALKQEPQNALHYLNLARIHLLAGQKTDAVRVLRQGASLGESDDLAELLERLGSRKPPLFRSLPREHFLNKYLGLILSRLRLR